MWNRLTKPFGNVPENDENQSRLLTGFLLILLITGVASAIIFVLFTIPERRLEALFGSFFAFFLLFLPYLISRTRFYRFAAILSVSIIILLAIETYQTTANPVTLATLIIPVFLTALLAPFWFAVLVTVFILLLISFLPPWLFGFSFQESSLSAIYTFSWLISLSLLSAIQYRRIVGERQKALEIKETTLVESRMQLEQRVAERTAELQAANTLLENEIEERIAIETRLNERDKQLSELNQQVVFAQEEERRRMSRELHDDAGQALTALRFKLALIRDQVRMSAMDGGQPPLLPQMLDEAVERVDLVMGGIRSLAHGLRPAALDELGLHPALEGLCADFSTQTGLIIHYEGHPCPPLSGAVEIGLYRFLQEALTNIARHAGAENIQVSLTYDEQAVYVSVTDDGIGFDPKNLALQSSGEHSGIGLLGIRERLEAHGGKLELFTQPGRGTHLTARVPRPAQPKTAPVIAEPVPQPTTDLIRVVIAEDHHVVRAAVAEWLNREDGIQVVGEVEDGADLLPMVEETSPTVLLLDVNMPNQRATEAVIAIRARFPHVRILIFSAHDRPEYVLNLVTAGVMGYVLKDDSPKTVLQAIRSVAAGKTWLTPRVAHIFQEGNDYQENSLLATLTPRETEVLQLMVDGCSNEDMAETLVLSVQTVRNHASSVYRKIGVNSRVEAVLAAIRLGMEPSPWEDEPPD